MANSQPTSAAAYHASVMPTLLPDHLSHPSHSYPSRPHHSSNLHLAAPIHLPPSQQPVSISSPSSSTFASSPATLLPHSQSLCPHPSSSVPGSAPVSASGPPTFQQHPNLQPSQSSLLPPLSSPLGAATHNSVVSTNPHHLDAYHARPTHSVADLPPRPRKLRRLDPPPAVTHTRVFEPSLPPLPPQLSMSSPLSMSSQPSLSSHPSLSSQPSLSPQPSHSVSAGVVSSKYAHTIPSDEGLDNTRSREMVALPDLPRDDKDHERETPFTCAHCAARFPDREQRKKHMKIAHGKRFACESCGSRFTRKFDLEKHALTVHEGMRPFQCDLCRNCFGQKHHLLRHKKSVHIKARDYACDSCSSRFARKEHLDNHQRSLHNVHKPHLCFLCDMRYTLRSALQAHMEEKHKVKSTRLSILSDWQPNDKERLSIKELVQL